MPQAAAIYARISQDRAGEGLGVQRQLADCRAEAARRGWPVVAGFVDDDVSAYSRKARPEYRRMLDAIRAGEVDAVVVYHLDRLHRRPIELRSSLPRARWPVSPMWRPCTVRSTWATGTASWSPADGGGGRERVGCEVVSHEAEDA